MPIKWSRIHVELGMSPTPLTYEMVRRAVEQRIAEAEDLDWKQALPQGPEKKWKDFATDVAAMANVGGGLIVFGVSEADERAHELIGVDNGPSQRQTLTSYALRWVRPVIGELVIEPLDDPNGGDRGLIAVLVPASPDAPHMIGEQNAMGVPYRYGRHASWMSESDLERAYRDRFSRRADDRAALTALIDGLVPEIDLDKGVWLALSARPILPPPPRTPRTDSRNATASILDALALAEQITGDAGRFERLLGLSNGVVNNPRTGLRRWRFRTNHPHADPHVLADWPLVELHHSGGIALAVELTSTFSRSDLHSDSENADVHWVPVRTLDLLVGAGVALASAHVRRLGGTGTILARADLLTSKIPPHKPLTAVEPIAPRANIFDRVSGSWSVRTPIAVEGAFAADSDTSALRDAARQLAEDLNHQFGKPYSSLPD